MKVITISGPALIIEPIHLRSERVTLTEQEKERLPWQAENRKEIPAVFADGKWQKGTRIRKIAVGILPFLSCIS